MEQQSTEFVDNNPAGPQNARANYSSLRWN